MLAGNGRIAQLLRRMKQNNSQRRWEDGQSWRSAEPVENNNSVVEIEAKKKQCEDYLEY